MLLLYLKACCFLPGEPGSTSSVSKEHRLTNSLSYSFTGKLQSWGRYVLAVYPIKLSSRFKFKNGLHLHGYRADSSE